MSGLARLEQAFKLSDFVRELALKGIQDEMRYTRTQAVKEFLKRMYGIAIAKGKVQRVASNYVFQNT